MQGYVSAGMRVIPVLCESESYSLLLEYLACTAVEVESQTNERNVIFILVNISF